MEASSGFSRRLIWVIWHAFPVAGVAEVVYFTVFDPFEQNFFAAVLDESREVTCTMGFFGFWALGADGVPRSLAVEGESRHHW
jgi:hypothetical protein